MALSILKCLKMLYADYSMTLYGNLVAIKLLK